jgi:hypothetical protein
MGWDPETRLANFDGVIYSGLKKFFFARETCFERISIYEREKKIEKNLVTLSRISLCKKKDG